ncbi:MAG: cation diffusion facilitator family transporter, partial [Actinobacteria bacterium]
SHTGSDVLVSVGVIISLVLVKIGEQLNIHALQLADPIVALLVAGAIVYTAWGVFKQASATMSDSSRIPAGDICDVAMRIEGVRGCHGVRTRGSEAEVYADLHVQVDPSMTVAEGHDVAERVERELVTTFPQMADAIVHLEPYDDYQRAKTAEDQDAGRA